MNIIDLIRIQCIQENIMSKTVTLRIEEGLYKKIKSHAISENRTLSNFIETATFVVYQLQGYKRSNDTHI